MNCQKIKTKIINKTHSIMPTTEQQRQQQQQYNPQNTLNMYTITNISFQKCQFNPLTQVKLFDRNLIINK